MESINLQDFEKLGPFEIKDELIKLAKKTLRTTQSGIPKCRSRQSELDRHQTARGLLFLLGQFAITESKRVMEHPAGIGGMPQAQGIAGRLEAWLTKHAEYAWCTLSLSDGAVCGEEIWVRTRCICPRTVGLDHWRHYPCP